MLQTWNEQKRGGAAMRLTDRWVKFFLRAGLGSVVALTLVLTSSGAWARVDIPECMNGRQELDVNNQQVVRWKNSTRNSFKARAYVQGRVVETYLDRNSHLHFSIEIDSRSKERLEVVYNKEFGRCPLPAEGQTVLACGDYITANAATDRYQPSPDGAIIHWVHMSPDLNRHEHGFLVINGTLCGMEEPKDRGRRR